MLSREKIEKTIFYNVYEFFKCHPWYVYNIIVHKNHWPVFNTILEKEKLVYIENTKVACTSIRASMKQKEKIKKNFALTEEQRDYYIFSYVRNPFARLVSCYNNKICNKNDNWLYVRYMFYALRYGLSKKISFKDFVVAIEKIPENKRDIHFRTQHSILYKIHKPVEKIDYIWKFENLQEDFEQNIAQKFSLPSLPKKNTSAKKWQDWRDYYDLKTAEIVYNIYKKDIDTWYPEAYDELKEYLALK